MLLLLCILHTGLYTTDLGKVCLFVLKKKAIPLKMVFHTTGKIYRQIIFYYILSRTVAVKKFRNSGNINPEISSNMWNIARFRNNPIMSDFGGKISSV